jgi:uncharacterized membrane protein HdeD (DUF308 family)
MDLLKHNVGKIDRIVRIILGLLLIGNVFFALQHPIGWIGVILLITGIAGICPLYSLLGMNTKSAAERIGLD